MEAHQQRLHLYALWPSITSWTCYRHIVAVIVTELISMQYLCMMSDRSPGFGITLAAETTGGAFLCAEACSSHLHGSTGQQRLSADDIGAKAAFNLLAEIYKVSVFFL